MEQESDEGENMFLFDGTAEDTSQLSYTLFGKGSKNSVQKSHLTLLMMKTNFDLPPTTISLG